jgi:hypothetical protein
MNQGQPHAEGVIALQSRVTFSCAHPSSIASLSTPIRLGPLDQVVFPFVPIAVVFVYPHPSTELSEANASTKADLIPLNRLQRALERVLDYYPHLSGRLQLNENDKSPEIGSLGKGADLLSATCNARLQSFYSASEGRLIVTDLPDGGNSLLAPYNPDFQVICKNPLLTVQHTRFACGSVALGIRLPHILCDGDGYFQFCRDLAEIYREIRRNEATPLNEIKLQQEPLLQPYLGDLYQMTDTERKEALEFKPWLFTYSSPSEEATSAQSPPPPLVTGKVLRFSASELQSLKLHATDQTAKNSFATTFDALAAHLYQRVYHARKQHAKHSGNTEQEISTAFLAPVNQRGVDRLNLTNRYFANAVLAVFGSLPTDTLENGPLHTIASHVHNLVRAVSPEEANKTLRWISAQTDKSRILPGFRLDQNIFMASQWCKFGVYAGMDFDEFEGKKLDAALAFPPFTPISLVDGLTYFMATEEQLKHGPSDSSIDVAMALLDDLWPNLDQDPLFRKFKSQSIS